MTQLNGAEIKTSMTSAASNFINALRTGLNLDGVQNGIFSDLLKQVVSTSSQQKPNNSDIIGQLVERSNALATRNEVRVSPDDNEKLRSLLQRIQRDVDGLRDRVRSADNDEPERKESKTDSLATSKSDKKPEASVKKTNATEKDQGTDNAVPVANDDAYVVVEEDAIPTTDVMVAGQIQGNKEVDKVTDQLISITNGDMILYDLIKTEQAALSLLQKIFQGDSESETVDFLESAPTDDKISAEEVITALKSTSSKSEENVPAQKYGQTPTIQSDQDITTASAQDDQESDALVRSTSSPNAGSKVETTVAEKSTAKINEKFDILNIFNNINGSPQLNNSAASSGVSYKNAAMPDLVITAEAKQGAKISGAAGTSSNPILAEGAKPAGSYDFASQLSAARATKGGATGLPNVVEQVALQLNKQVRDGVEQMTIQLRPAELGRIEIKLEFSNDNKVTGTVMANNPATLDLLLKDVGSLQRALQDAGLRADAGSLQFSLRGDGQSGFPNQNADNKQNTNAGSDIYGQEFDDANGLMSADVETYYITPGRVNLRV